MPNKYEIPEKCPYCDSNNFMSTKSGDIMCGKCGSFVAKWFDYPLPEEY